MFIYMDRLIIALAVVALVALGVWFYTSNNTGVTPPSDIATTTSASITEKPRTPTTPPTSAGSGNTYTSLLTQSGSYLCDYNQVQSAGQMHNQIYIYGGKLRGEFRTITGEPTPTNLVLYDGHYLYTWSEGASSGTRTVLTSLSQLPLVIPKDLTGGSIHGTAYESVGWDCHFWMTDTKLFVPPSYVKFSGA